MVLILAVLIWNGAKVLGSAWDDVRQVRESDKILAVLESQTSRLQNLITRYSNQPSPELFAEILLLREAVLGTLTTRASTDPMLSGSVERLEQVTDRFLNGFGELRGVQADRPVQAALPPAEPESAPVDALLQALGHDPVTLDALMARTGASAAELTVRLLELELQGSVARLPGGLYQRRFAG